MRPEDSGRLESIADFVEQASACGFWTLLGLSLNGGSPQQPSFGTSANRFLWLTACPTLLAASLDPDGWYMPRDAR